MASLILENGIVLDLRDEELRSGMSLLLVDGRIAELSDQRIASPEIQRIDLRGRTVMPGLIDCHVHVTAIRLSLGLAPTRVLPASFVTAAASSVLRRMLLRGFTTVRDAAGADSGLRDALAAHLLDGPRLFIAGRAISQTGGHGDMRERVDYADPCGCAHMLSGMGRVADGVPAVQHAVRDEIRLGADQIKVMASGGVASAADPIHFLQYSDAELSAIVDEAQRADTYVMAHAYTAPAIARAARAGVRTIEHGNFLDPPTAELMAKRGTYLVPTLATYYMSSKYGAELGFPAESLAKLEKVMAVGSQVLQVAKDAGVKMAYGTDLLGELHEYQSEEFLIREKVLTPLEILQSVTLVGAEVLRMEGQLGVIAPGAIADLIVVDGNPLSDLAVLLEQGKHMPLIIKEGRVAKNELG